MKVSRRTGGSCLLIVLFFIACYSTPSPAGNKQNTDKSNNSQNSVFRTLDASLASAASISVIYSYSGMDGKYGIASEAEFHTGNHPDPFAHAYGAGMCDEDGERRYKVKFNLPGEGNKVVSLVARFRFTGQGAQIRKATLDQRWETRYIFPDENADLRLGIPRVETFDLATGKKVAETKNIKLMPPSGKATSRLSSKITKDFMGDVISQSWNERLRQFSGEEYCYDDDRLVFVSSFVRDVATGLIVSEMVKKGRCPRDYHHYELVVISWPDDRMVCPKVDLVPDTK